MANNIQESILNAVDFLVKDRLSGIKSDKTITATVITCTNALTGEYKVSYQGGFMFAYAQEGATFSQNTSVYVLVPEGDFSKKKVILSKAQHLDGDENISFISSAISSYNLIGRNVISDKNNNLPGKMFSYKKENYLLLYQYGEPENSLLEINGEELLNYLKEAEALLLEASFKTRLPKAHRYSKTGDYGLQFVFVFKDGDKTDEEGNAQIKKLPYRLDLSSMTGNPLLFTNWSEQYNIFKIDVENFLYIESILAYAKDFVEEDNTKQMALWGEDIFFKDLEIYGLRKISATNGEYKLTLSTPKGATFKDTSAESQLQVLGKIVKKSTNISDSTTFYWFAEDGRINSSSEEYHMYGGAGWRYLKKKANNYTFLTYANENHAYENKYLCVAVYQEEVVLKETFVIYNDACKRELTISSDLGVKFSFDRGIPTLTCLIDGKSEGFEEGKQYPHPDEFFTFIWSKLDEYGDTIIFNQTYKELKKEYDEKVKSGKASYSELSAIKNKMAEMEKVEFEKGKNKIKYPINQIDARATFRCSVYLKDTAGGEAYCIGSAQILLQNENSEAIPTDYHIVIENGDQVFQYSESGVSPANERYTDPLEVKPLTAHFYDPAGLEVNKDTYTVKWKVPLSDSLLVVPTEGMELNPSTDKIEYCVSQVYPTKIKESYDYQALNNQITAVITYKDQEYTKDTTFLFTKVGENGTNGTDIVGRIRPISKSPLLDKELLYLELDSNGAAKGYNTGESASTQMFTLDLFQRDKMLETDNSSVKWSVAGGTTANSKYLSVIGGICSWNTEDSENRRYRNQILKASITVEGQQYYAFYPLPTVEHRTNEFRVILDKTRMLKSITYNADGRNPLYNKNQGIFISFNKKDIGDKYIVWDAFGGTAKKTGASYEDNPKNAVFSLLLEKNGKEGESHLEGENLTGIYILPDAICTGEFSNHVVRGRIYANKESANYEAEIYIPIYVSLNQFGLASLNAWDGNHVEINEDENYILAPQIGAGKKDRENKFTGIVMGVSKTYDQKKEEVGLLGYSEGRQSIWLDAETGKAVFGLPEKESTKENNYTEGRIELNPNGDSKIGQWTIGSRAMYHMTKVDELGNSTGGVPSNEIPKPYKDYPVKNAQISVPSEAQGIILNADPAYVSFKGRPLTRKNSDIQFDHANTAIKEGDSFEVEINPASSSAFTIFRHTQYTTELDENGKPIKGEDWRRHPLVGINAQGQFYTNAIENEESSMGIGKIGAFGSPASDAKYIGAQFGYDDTNLFKFFIEPNDEKGDLATCPLFLSTGTTISNEYPRDMNLYGNKLVLHASPTGSTSKTSTQSNHFVEVDKEQILLKHHTYKVLEGNKEEDNINQLLIKAGNGSEIENASKFTVSTPFVMNVGNGAERISDFTFGGATSLSITNVLSMNADKSKGIAKEYLVNYSSSFGKDISISKKNAYDFSILKDSITLASTAKTEKPEIPKVQLKINPLSGADFFYNGKYNLTTHGAISIKSEDSQSVTIQSVPIDGKEINASMIKLMSSMDTSTSYACQIKVPLASITSMDKLGSSDDSGSGWQITPGISTEYMYITGTIPGHSYTSLIIQEDMHFSKFGWSKENWGKRSSNDHALTNVLVNIYDDTRKYAKECADNAEKNAKDYTAANFSWNNHNHDGVYAYANHNHDGVYAYANHNHNGVYAYANHNHNGAYVSVSDYRDFVKVVTPKLTDLQNQINALKRRVTSLESRPR